ncbi:MAG: hypothetical protein ACRCYC_09960 [Paraclostridium sp.]|uniref:hypothetical protein n=1 Tax=Paraclostridium sp. TaxID=2023273 RepID=UPI003F37409C
MGNKIEILQESYKLLLKAEDELKNNFDYESNIKNSFLDKENEVIVIEDKLGSYIQYDVCDCYTALIKIRKLYNNFEIHRISNKLKKISIEVDMIQ